MFRKGARDTRKWTTLSIIVMRLTFTQRKIKPGNKEGTHPLSILYEGAKTDCAFTPEQEQVAMVFPVAVEPHSHLSNES